jgi:hypothetical protein
VEEEEEQEEKRLCYKLKDSFIFWLVFIILNEFVNELSM